MTSWRQRHPTSVAWSTWPWLLLLLLQAPAMAMDLEPLTASDSLCGEGLVRQTGILHGLYYVFYEASATANTTIPREDVPVVLWLSGGPGCSGLVAALFELGPCTFDDETSQVTLNPSAWTNVAHVIFVDQPLGTGFSDPMPIQRNRATDTWDERDASANLGAFIDAFFVHNPALVDKDFYIFGESYGGHYVPDLGNYLLETDAGRWRHRLKGVGIGNGVVSNLAYLETFFDFAKGNKYANDIVGAFDRDLRLLNAQATRAGRECKASMLSRNALATTTFTTTHHRLRRLSLANTQICHEAIELGGKFSQLALMATIGAGHNMYDLRRKCHLADRLGLCYRFSRLEEFVNEPAVLTYFGNARSSWQLCNLDVLNDVNPLDAIDEHDAKVAKLLDAGVRVLVYVGDADTMAPWNMHERWTRDMAWGGQGRFNASPTVPLRVHGKTVGTLQTAGGLSLVRVFDAGHMVPRDQPAVALEMLRQFLYVSHVNGGMFT